MSEESPKLNLNNDIPESRGNAAEVEATKEVEATPSSGSNISSDDNACVVCFKDVEIYSIGECDHPVCYECSTRMRVLCQQNECPICRHVLSKVIFAYEKLPYRELESKNRSEYYSKKYKIGFYTNKIQQAFFDLLDHQCPKCNAPPYRTFNGLKSHVRKEHDLHYCDLCTEHLKIFTFERRCYTQAELGLHRVKGDADNKSHRGHPICEYCNCRYLDRDELFRHLRRDHYFCHFCDADGYNDFYKDYNALAEHFRKDHFLCEEGKCSTEQFTGAFRSEIDYKAHVANVHGKSLNKQQVKQARTLQLEITLGRRGRSGQPEQGIANLRSRGNEEMNEELDEDIMSQYNAQQNQRSLTIDAQNEQDFPSLGGASGSAMSLVRPSLISMRNRGTAGLARTKENFPALGGGGVGEIPSTSVTGPQRQAQISNVLKKSTPSTAGTKARSSNTNNNGNNNATGMVIHVSNRPAATTSNNNNNNHHNNSNKSNALDFPALPAGKPKKYAVAVSRNTSELPSSSNLRSAAPIPKHRPQVDEYVPISSSGTFQVTGKSKKHPATTNRQLDEDMLPSGSNVQMENVSAKHRILVDDYVSVANPSTFQKLQLVQKEELDAKTRKAAADLNAPKLTTLDFPTLGGNGNGNGNGNGSGNSSRTNTSSWLKNSTNDKKQREVENRKSKIAPAPFLPKQTKLPVGTSATHINNTTEGLAQKKESKKKEGKQQDSSPPDSVSKTSNKLNKEKNNNNNENKPENANLNKIVATTSLHNNDANNTSAARPPPGFISSNTNGGSLVMKPPPGFQSNVIVNSVAKSPNNLTFTSSLGESYSIVPTHSYIQPPEAITRNQKLVGHFKESLNTPEALDEFRQISQKFREGVYRAPAYYEHCQAALKDKFDKIFPELLALLPDISKQQALFLVHSQRLKSLSADQRKKLPNLDVCSICKQVLLSIDFDNHKKLHSHKTNFPTLNSSSASKATTGNRK